MTYLPKLDVLLPPGEATAEEVRIRTKTRINTAAPHTLGMRSEFRDGDTQITLKDKRPLPRHPNLFIHQSLRLLVVKTANLRMWGYRVKTKYKTIADVQLFWFNLPFCWLTSSLDDAYFWSKCSIMLLVWIFSASSWAGWVRTWKNGNYR